ncbi:MAG: hypothetical protein K0Q57_67 [Gammaproteobacteria bacterium]|nr:hypothetical protein [Gammaproteobacteria bacterium]
MNGHDRNTAARMRLHKKLYGKGLQQLSSELVTAIGEEKTVEALSSISGALVHQAAAWNDVKKLKELLDAGADIESLAVADNTPLHAAAGAGHEEAARLLIERGANIEAIAIQGATPLAMAVRSGQLKTVQLLLEKGAKANWKHPSGETLLHFAISSQEGHSELKDENVAKILAKLLEHGLSPNTYNNEQKTPLYFALVKENWPAFQELLKAGADLKQLQLNSDTYLHVLASKPEPSNRLSSSFQSNILKVLMAQIDPAIINRQGLTAKCIALLSGNQFVAKALKHAVFSSADLAYLSREVLTALTNQDAARIKFLQSVGFGLNDCIFTVSPLHWAAYHKNLEAVLLILEFEKGRAMINVQDPDGDTALHYAATAQHKGIADVLLKAGADPNIKNLKGEVPAVLKIENAKSLSSSRAPSGSMVTFSSTALSDSASVASESSDHSSGRVILQSKVIAKAVESPLSELELCLNRFVSMLEHRIQILALQQQRMSKDSSEYQHLQALNQIIHKTQDLVCEFISKQSLRSLKQKQKVELNDLDMHEALSAYQLEAMRWNIKLDQYIRELAAYIDQAANKELYQQLQSHYFLPVESMPDWYHAFHIEGQKLNDMFHIYQVGSQVMQNCLDTYRAAKGWPAVNLNDVYSDLDFLLLPKEGVSLEDPKVVNHISKIFEAMGARVCLFAPGEGKLSFKLAADKPTDICVNADTNLFKQAAGRYLNVLSIMQNLETGQATASPGAFSALSHAIIKLQITEQELGADPGRLAYLMKQMAKFKTHESESSIKLRPSLQAGFDSLFAEKLKVKVFLIKAISIFLHKYFDQRPAAAHQLFEAYAILPWLIEVITGKKLALSHDAVLLEKLSENHYTASSYLHEALMIYPISNEDHEKIYAALAFKPIESQCPFYKMRQAELATGIALAH